MARIASFTGRRDDLEQRLAAFDVPAVVEVVIKYSDDQPRDDRGRFGSGGGDSGSDIQNMKSANGSSTAQAKELAGRIGNNATVRKDGKNSVVVTGKGTGDKHKQELERAGFKKEREVETQGGKRTEYEHPQRTSSGNIRSAVVIEQGLGGVASRANQDMIDKYGKDFFDKHYGSKFGVETSISVTAPTRDLGHYYD